MTRSNWLARLADATARSAEQGCHLRDDSDQRLKIHEENDKKATNGERAQAPRKAIVCGAGNEWFRTSLKDEKFVKPSISYCITQWNPQCGGAAVLRRARCFRHA